MTFYVDFKFALKHYARGGLLLMILGIISFILGLKYVNIFLICISPVLFCISLILLSLNFYGNLTFYGSGVMIGRRENYGYTGIGYSSTMKSNAYMYEVVNLSNIKITRRNLILSGTFKKSKLVGKPVYLEDKLNIQNINLKKIKIPRIYEKESVLLEELNKFKSK